MSIRPKTDQPAPLRSKKQAALRGPRVPDSKIPSWISSASLWLPEYISESGWLEHGPFAFWLIDAARPHTFVELGTHSGYSFFAFCQAVEALGLGTQCYAVGFYGEDVFSSVKAYRARRYARSSHLVRATFDNAVSRFQDGTIDLLHIDGRHFYDDVRHDFSTWKQKLSMRGIVVLHDICIRKHGFGVWKFWNELKLKYPFFEFKHGNGLGIVAIGSETPEGTKSLFAANRKEQLLVRSFFNRLGGSISDKLSLRAQQLKIDNLSAERIIRTQEVEALKVVVADREERAASLDRALNGRTQEVEALKVVVADREERVASLDGALTARSKEVDALKVVVADREERVASLDRALTARSKEVDALKVVVADREERAASLDRALTARSKDVDALKAVEADSEERAAGLDKALAARDNEIEAFKAVVADREERAAGLAQALVARDNEIEAFKAVVADREERAAGLAQALVARHNEIEAFKVVVADRELQIQLSQSTIAAIHASTSWRIVSPLRLFKRLAQQLGTVVRYSLTHGGRISRKGLFTSPRDRRAIRIIEQSRLFDRRWYVEKNPDVVARLIDPVQHYVIYGVREGRDPSPSFSTRDYLMHHPDLAMAGINPLAHFVLHPSGKDLNAEVIGDGGKAAVSAPRLRQAVLTLARRIYRALPLQDQKTKFRLRSEFLRYFGFLLPEATADFADPPLTPQKLAANPESLDNPRPFSWSYDSTAYFLSPTEQPLHDDGYSVSRFMYHVWWLRPDLRQAFDLYDRDSRVEFCKWFLLNAVDEYALPDQVYSDELLIKLARTNGPAAIRAHAILDKRNKLGPGQASSADESAAEPKLVSDLRDDGANLIGYCRGEFGMGEVVRATARAFDAVHKPFSMTDNQNVGSHGFRDDSIRHWITNIKKYRTNIFCINADSLPLLYFSLGRSLFLNCYNIGYWAWELSKCPLEFNLALEMVDEVWGISEFVAESYRTRSTVPVFSMPLAVSLPVLQRQYSKSYFGLPKNCFQFLFTFDAASYIDRKNPIAAVRAFRLAFPRGDEKVHLLIKTMNTHSEDPLWNTLVAEAKLDARIAIMDKRLERDEVLGLNSVCDAFVSLHRSEGFGFNLAEAMLIGKPVIATNYSGSREFAREGTACVVDYRLVPVPERAYPFSPEQVWAEPNIEHAAVLMRRLTYDDAYRENIARAGQRFVSENFNEAKIGARYAARLEEVKNKIIRSAPAQQLQWAAMTPLASNVDDEIEGYLDLPVREGSKPIHAGTIEIAGWAASKLGIKSVEIYCDGNPLGIAHYGMLRPDIGKAFPNFKNAGRSGFFWMLDASPLAAGTHVVRAVARSRSGHSLEWTREFTLASSTPYQQWMATNALGSKEKKELVARAERLMPKSTVTIVMVSMADVDHDALSSSMASLAGQIYQNFKLIIVVPKMEGSQHIESAVAATGIVERLHLVLSERPHWLDSRAGCDGDFVGVMDIGDVLDPRALLAVAENIARDFSIDLLYADEDRIGNGVRAMPTFKPAFSPIYLDRYNYIGRPWFARTTLFKEATENAEPKANLSEHALLKSLGCSARAVCHIPMILASRSSHAASSACADLQRAEDDTLSKAGVNENSPRISIVIPTCLHEREIAMRCFNGLAKRTDYPNLEVIVVVNNVPDEAVAKAFLANWPFTVCVWEGAFNWSAINNFGAKHVTGDYLMFLNDDVEPLDPGWLKQMVRIARVQSVGAVGATLKYSNNTLQHAGITISNHAGASRYCGRHVFRFCLGNEAHIASLAHHDHECRAVTGACLLTRRDCFDAVSGFDEDLALVTNDTDYCLRLAEQGYSTVIASGAVLIHDEGISRSGMPEGEDVNQFWKRWAPRLSADDPFSNPNLDVDKDDWSVNPNAVGTMMGRIRRQGEASKI
jgi:O-antigen biosynthesis protein